MEEEFREVKVFTWSTQKVKSILKDQSMVKKKNLERQFYSRQKNKQTTQHKLNAMWLQNNKKCNTHWSRRHAFRFVWKGEE